MRLLAFILTPTKITLQHGLPVEHIGISTKVWKFWIFKIKYLPNHLSPNQNFDGSELPTSWKMQAYQNFENCPSAILQWPAMYDRRVDSTNLSDVVSVVRSSVLRKFLAHVKKMLVQSARRKFWHHAKEGRQYVTQVRVRDLLRDTVLRARQWKKKRETSWSE